MKCPSSRTHSLHKYSACCFNLITNVTGIIFVLFTWGTFCCIIQLTCTLYSVHLLTYLSLYNYKPKHRIEIQWTYSIQNKNDYFGIILFLFVHFSIDYKRANIVLAGLLDAKGSRALDSLDLGLIYKNISQISWVKRH